MDEKECNFCGAILDEEDSYCPECGTSFEDDDYVY